MKSYRIRNVIRNGRIRGTMKVGEISQKVQKSLKKVYKWYESVMRREEEYVA